MAEDDISQADRGLKSKLPLMPAVEGRGASPHYAAFIRFPFPRGTFVEPPLIDWNADRNHALWKLLSRKPKSSDIDWEMISAKFDVPLEFVLQQAAWLYQSHLSDMRLQMRKISQSATASPIAALEPFVPAEVSSLSRPGSHDSPRKLSIAHSNSIDATTGMAQRTIVRSRGNSYERKTHVISRTNSTNTITQSRQLPPSSPDKLVARSSRGNLRSSPRQRQGLTRDVPPQNSIKQESSEASSNDSSDSASSNELGVHSQLGKSQMFRRAPRFSTSKESRLSATDGEDADSDSEPTFFTFAQQPSQPQQDLTATLRMPETPAQSARPPIGVTTITSAGNTDSSASSIASSAAPVSSPQRLGINPHGVQKPPGPLSPRQRAQLAGTRPSPRHRAIGGKDGSDGTPSMGSSFSDLDDFSGTQSALEDALNSEMQRGNFGSRISNIGDTLHWKHR